MRALIWSVTARNDLQRIVDHYASFDRELGLDVIDAIQARAASLPESPFMGAPLDGSPLRKLSMPQRGFVILYRVTDSKVEVARVHHMRENWR